MRPSPHSLILALALAATLPVVGSAAEAPRLKIRVTPSFGVAPALIRIEAAITPHADNRAVEFTADSMDYYRSSRIEIDGSTAPAAVRVEFPAVPEGEYDVRVALVGCHGTRAELTEHVLIMP